MRKIALTALIVLTASGLALAQPPRAPGNPAPPMKAMAHHTGLVLTGKIQSVTEADMAKGTKSEISIVSADNTVKAFLVKAGATIYDSTGKALLLKDLKKDETVKVHYKTSPEGVLEAVAIYQMK